MPINGNANIIYEQSDLAVDANSLNATTTPIRTGGAQSIGLFIKAASGAHTSHIIMLQVSPNGNDWYDVATATVTGVGGVMHGNCVSQYARARVSTVEGAASTVDVMIIAK